MFPRHRTDNQLCGRESLYCLTVTEIFKREDEPLGQRPTPEKQPTKPQRLTTKTLV